MISLVRKNLGCLIPKQNSSLCKYHVSLSLLLRNFSASAEREVVTTTAVYDVLVNKHHFSPEIASAVSSDLSRFRSPEKADSILTFLEDNCFSSSQLQRLVKYDPRILTAIFEDRVKLKINIFKDFGFSPEEIAKMASSILHLSAEKKIVPQLSTLKGLLGSNHEAVAVVKRSAWYITVDLKKIFVPNVEFLKSCGVTTEGIRILLYNFPWCLLMKPDAMRGLVEKTKEMGLNPSSKVYVYAVRALASLSDRTWELKLQGFRGMGFSEGEVLALFRRSPAVFCTSLEKMKEIKRLLLATERYEMCDLVCNPWAFMCSVEQRYKPRLRILQMLESRGLIEKWPPQSSISKWPDDRFFEVFVRPYSFQLGEVCVAFKGKERSKK